MSCFQLTPEDIAGLRSLTHGEWKPGVANAAPWPPYVSSYPPPWHIFMYFVFLLREPSLDWYVIGCRVDDDHPTEILRQREAGRPSQQVRHGSRVMSVCSPQRLCAGCSIGILLWIVSDTWEDSPMFTPFSHVWLDHLISFKVIQYTRTCAGWNTAVTGK